MNILIYKFQITPSLKNDRGNYRIYIKGKDLSMLKPHILPFFVEHFYTNWGSFSFFYVVFCIFSECKVLDSGRSSQYSAENSMSKKGDALNLSREFASKLRPLWLG